MKCYSRNVFAGLMFVGIKRWNMSNRGLRGNRLGRHWASVQTFCDKCIWTSYKSFKTVSLLFPTKRPSKLFLKALVNLRRRYSQRYLNTQLQLLLWARFESNPGSTSLDAIWKSVLWAQQELFEFTQSRDLHFKKMSAPSLSRTSSSRTKRYFCAEVEQILS